MQSSTKKILIALAILVPFVLIAFFLFFLDKSEVEVPLPEEVIENEEGEEGEEGEEVIEENQELLEVLSFLNSNFKFKAKTGTEALTIEEFMEAKEGGEQDFSFFTKDYLYQKGYIVTFVFVYEYTDKDGQKKNRYLTVVNDSGTPKYFHFNEQGAHLVSYYGRNFLELCLKEQKRTGLKISRYGTTPFDSTNLDPPNWEIFDK
jgi:hypothetical protein